MIIYSNGKRLEIPSGGSGESSTGGGNPVGTVISFMGTSAPKDYLVCDGAEYSISQYPDLAAFFEAQFGAKNHFGGDGISTFSVPDMRNLFLRGYHGEAEEQLSGEIGTRQDATVIPSTISPSATSSYVFGFFKKNPPAHTIAPKNADKEIESLLPTDKYAVIHANSGDVYNFSDFGSSLPDNSATSESYTSRPVNMAVLYCIKATESVGISDSSGGASAGQIYSTEEVLTGKWMDEDHYCVVFLGELSQLNGQVVGTLNGVKEVTSMRGSLVYKTGATVPLSFAQAGSYSTISTEKSGDDLIVYITSNVSTQIGGKFNIAIEYTKTTG